MLDYHNVVGVFAFFEDLASNTLLGKIGSGLEKYRIGSHHVVDLLRSAVHHDSVGRSAHHTRLGDLLASELPLRAQVLAIIVAQVIVRSNRQRLDTGIDKKFGEDRLDFGLTRLEIVTADKGLVPLSKLDASRHKGVLGRSVDEGDAFQDTGHSKNG